MLGVAKDPLQHTSMYERMQEGGLFQISLLSMNKQVLINVFILQIVKTVMEKEDLVMYLE